MKTTSLMSTVMLCAALSPPAILSVAVSTANAAIVVTSAIGGAPTGAAKINFDDLTPGSYPAGVLAVGPDPTGITVITGGIAPNDGRVVSGTNNPYYAMPFMTGNNDLGFHPPGAAPVIPGPDTTVYLAAGRTIGAVDSNDGSITLVFPGPKSYMGLLWGSVDDNAAIDNSLAFYNDPIPAGPVSAGAVLIGTVTGSDVVAVAPVGSQGADGTAYVNINLTGGQVFNKVVARSSGSTGFTFEFDNVAFNILNLSCVVAECVETVNPSGKNIPTAGANPKSGQNPDGYYKLTASNPCRTVLPGELQIFIKDSAEGPCGGAFIAGPFAPGTDVKLTQSPGQNSWKDGPKDIAAHINTKGDPILVVIDTVTGEQTCHLCFLPPKPK